MLRITEEHNILTRSGFRAAILWIREACAVFGSKRVLVWYSLPCRGGTTWRHVNMARALRNGDTAAVTRLEAVRANGLKLCAAAERLVRATRDADPGLAWEWPRACSYWREPSIATLHVNSFPFCCDVHGCMVGLTSINQSDVGRPMKKAWQIRSNRRVFCEQLHIVCDRSHIHAHVEGGKNTRQTERYTPIFADRVHRAFVLSF